MASIKKSKKATRKTKAIRQAIFRTNTLAAGRARWEVLVSGSEKMELKKLLAAIRKATTGSAPAPATGSAPAPAKPATTGSVPAATTGSADEFDFFG